MAETSVWIFILSAVLATYVWRFAAVMISHRIKVNHPIFEWFTCLAYGIIAALVARTLILPTGLLALLPFWHRLIPMVLAFLGFYLLGKRLWVGIVFGETCLIALMWFNNGAEGF